MEVEHNAETDEESQLFNLDFRRYFEALRKYIWLVLAIITLSVTAAVVYTTRQPQIFQAKASVQIEPKIADLLGQGQEILNGTGIGGTTDYYKQQKQVLGSFRLVRQTVDQHRLYTRLLTEAERADKKLDEQIELATRQLRKRLTIQYPDQNRIMYVVVRHESPELAAEIANLHVATYVDYARGLLSMDTRKASSALSTEFDDAEKQLRDAESALYQFQKDNDLLAVTLEEKQSLVSSGITAYTMKLNEAKSHRIEVQSRLAQMKKANTDDVLTSPVLVMGDNNSFDALRAQYYAERNKFVELEKEVGPKNSQYIMQKAKLDDLYSALKAETTRMVLGMEEQLKAQLATEVGLQKEVDNATKLALELGPKIVAYNELVRRKRSMEDRYNILRTRLSTSELTDRMNRTMDTNVRPLDPALVPTRAVSPSMKVNVAIASALSILFGLGVVLLLVFLDRSVKSAGDAQQATGHSVLGIIPALDESEFPARDDKSRDLYVHNNPSSRVAEFCRSLRTNILFSSADKELKTFVVSSANPREGKTTSVIYLGTTMAQSGQRVLLVDTDMRRPRLHVSMGIPRDVGITNLIVGDASYEQAIKTTAIPNLFLLPCGALPPNPAEILMSQKFESVLRELQSRFDRIILDSPPLGVVTDAVVLSKITDGAILVAKSNQTLREDLKRATKHIRNVRGNIVGVILNALVPDNRSGYYYSYYGYKEDPQKDPKKADDASDAA